MERFIDFSGIRDQGCIEMTISVFLSSHPADIGGGQWITRVFKDLRGWACLDEPARSVVNPEQGGIVRDTARLSQVMSDDQNRIASTEPDNEILNDAAGNRIEGAAGLIHEQHLRGKRQSSGNTEALLLAAGQSQRGRIQPILDLIPEPDIP